MGGSQPLRVLVLDVLWRERGGEKVPIVLGGLQLHQRVLEYLNKKVLTIGLTSYPPAFKHKITYSVKQGCGKLPRLEFYKYLMRLIITLWRIISRHKPHIIYNSGVGWHNDWLALIAKLAGLKVASYFHHYALPGGRVIYPKSILDLPALTRMCREIKRTNRFPFFKLMDYLILFLQLRFADVVFTGTSFGLDQLRGLGRRGPIILTGIGIDLEEFKEVAPAVGERVWDGLFVGRMAPEKGVYDLLFIWRRVVDAIPDAKLAVVGKIVQPYYDRWVKILKKLNLERNVFHLGELKREELLETYYKAKIFVFPSKMEGAGIAIAEAMAAGLVVIAYPLPAYKSLYSNAKSVYFCNTVEAFSKKIISLLKSDRQLERLGGYNREYALKNFSWENVSEKIYLRIAGDSNK